MLLDLKCECACLVHCPPSFPIPATPTPASVPSTAAPIPSAAAPVPPATDPVPHAATGTIPVAASTAAGTVAPAPSVADPSEDGSVDDLADELEYLNIEQQNHGIPQPVYTSADMLRTNEVRVGTCIPITAIIRLFAYFYVVIHGREVGVFDAWGLASEQVNGYPSNVHMRYKTPEEALSRWTDACTQGLVRNPVHPRSMFPRIVTDEQLQRRADEANVTAYITGTAPPSTTESTTTTAVDDTDASSDDAFTDALAAIDAPVAIAAPAAVDAPVAIDAPTATGTPIASTATSTNTVAVVTGVDVSVDTPATSTAVHLGDCERGERVWSEKGKERFYDFGPTNGYVVIRGGRRPGVYYDEEEWRDAMARGRGGWAFPCKSAEIAEVMFIRFSDDIAIVN